MDEEVDIKTAPQQDSNKFDMLCDGVLNSIALVQATLAEFLSLKDELLIHALPPTLMARLIMVSGRIFRSTNDLETPVNELVRLVRVFSVSWEEKSAALKKLHNDYESKHKQLNIAVRRLQLLDSQAKRMAKEKRIMMWEKLFSKVTSCRGHGRRWKFLIDNFKQKSKLGMEHLQAYIESLDKEPDSDGEGGDKDESNEFDGRSQSSVNELQLLSSSDELDFTEESDEDDEVKGHESTARATVQTQRDELDSDIVTPASKRVTFIDPKKGLGGPEVIPETVIVEVPAPKPPSADKTVWTHEPEYDWFFNIKVFHPVGITGPDIKCSINFKKDFKKTEFYARPLSRGLSGRRSQVRSGRGMIGSKIGKNNQPSKSVTLKLPDERNIDDRWQNLVFPIGDSPLFNMEDELTKKDEEADQAKEGEKDKKKEPEEEDAEEDGGDDGKDPSRVQSGHSTVSSLGGEMPLKLGVHQGHLDELIAMGNIDLADLRGEDIPIFESAEETGETLPHTFPIYPIKPSRKLKASPEAPVGSLPIIFFYTRIHKPFTFEKESETASITEIVEDLTGVDLNKMKKEDLSINKEYDERCLSAMTIRSATPSEKPEMVPKAELDIVIEQHNQELTVLTEDFESRIRDLAAALEAVQTEQLNLLSGAPPGQGDESEERVMEMVATSRSPFRGWTPGKDSQLVVPQPPDKDRSSSKKKGKKTGSKLPEWGSDLPKDFLERLQMFNEESEKRRQELEKKTKNEVSSHIEKQLAGTYKLSLQDTQSPDATKDISLPAVFMPTRTGQLYNPRAHHYFHPSGSLGHLRLTQPPSIFQLPPLPAKHKMSVINLFDIRKSMNWAMTEDWTNRIPQTPAELLESTLHPGTPMTNNTEPRANIAATDDTRQ
ncbi:uncharacterized protein LOC129283202 isoform X1 [Lytechinus pictus]|uniref:uncharacterized protein LOC129283202 isoform X1 n=1 Tax=Lytechinus pictus TaxID=7653 RepID=UPI0030B9B18C